MGLLQALAWFTMAGPAKLSRMLWTAWADGRQVYDPGKKALGAEFRRPAFS